MTIERPGRSTSAHERLTSSPRRAPVGLALAYTVIACLSVIAPTLAFVVDPDRMARPLESARTWLVQRNDTIITVVFVVIGAQVGDGVGQL